MPFLGWGLLLWPKRPLDVGIEERFCWLICVCVFNCVFKSLNGKLKGEFGRRLDMGIISTILGVFGFGIGIGIGVVIGYFLFIYSQPTEVKVCLFFLLFLEPLLCSSSICFCGCIFVNWGIVYHEMCCLFAFWFFVCWVYYSFCFCFQYSLR